MSTCGCDGVDGTGSAASALCRAADDAEVIGGAARRPLPLVEELVGGNAVGQRHPLAHRGDITSAPTVISRDTAWGYN